MNRLNGFLSLILISLAVVTLDAGASADIYQSLKFRNIGPGITSGRVTDLAVNPDNPAQYYAATAAGGIWKTNNAGVTWETVFDDQPVYSIGAIAMDPENHQVIWAGSGENNSQRSVAYGDGVYKSLDGGASWTNVGLSNSEHIGKVLIHPQNSNVVYVAAQGPLWSNGGDRGLYRTQDGGKSWQPLLQISKYTGVSDVIMDPDDADTLYAVAYQRRRHVWTLIDGGPESGLYKSTDGGESWRKINKGLPNVDLGRIGIAVAPSRPNTLYAVVEAAQGKSGFYRSDDKGESWQKQSSYVASSPQYYQELVVDPKNANKVYSLDTYLMVTLDGGKNFKRAGEKDKHVDNHALWIDPSNTQHMIAGCDGGIYETWDSAKNWQFKDNMSLTQFYKIAVDNDAPFYNVYGGTQDNATLGAPHRTAHSSGIRNQDWLYIQFGDGFKPAVDPENADIVYGQFQYGGLARYDKQSGEKVQIQPISPDPKVAMRFNWNSPLLISPHDPARIYYASQVVFQSDSRGDEWRAISGDLSRNMDRNKLKVMDRIWSVDAVAKNVSTSFYGSVVALTESPKQAGVLFAGTDDGVIQLTRNGGQEWQQADWPSKVPDYAYVSDLEASQFDSKVVFATFDNHKKGDFKPYVFRSDDSGRSWKNITGDLPGKGSTYTVAQDHINPSLLFVGTEFGVFFSQNGGKNWLQLKQGLPTIAVRDMEIQRREGDLVVGTFGRGAYVLDDYAPLRSNASDITSKPASVFPIRPAKQYIEYNPMGLPGKSMLGADFFMADNPEYGAGISFYIRDGFQSKQAKRRAAEKKLKNKQRDVNYPSWDALKEEDFEEKPMLLVTVKDAQGNLVRRMKKPYKAGFQRIFWDLRYPGFEPLKSKGDNSVGPMVVPGEYTVELAKWHNGEATMLAGPERFSVTTLDNQTFKSSTRDQDLQFDMTAGRLAQAVSGARRIHRELEGRLTLAEVAVVETLAADEQLLAKIHPLKQSLKQVKLEFTGNTVRSRRAEPAIESVTGYLGYLQWSRSENLGPVSELQRQRLSRASDGYARVYEQLTAIEAGVKALEKALIDSGANWMPGSPLRNGR